MEIMEVRAMLERKYSLGQRYFDLCEIIPYPELRTRVRRIGFIVNNQLADPPGKIASNITRGVGWLNLNNPQNDILPVGDISDIKPRKNRSITSDEMIARIIKAGKCCDTLTQAAKMAGVDAMTAAKYIRGAGIVKFNPEYKASKKAELEKRIIKTFKGPTLKYKDVAIKHDCSVSFVFAVAKKYNYSRYGCKS